jgi:hypothetical protein
MAKAQIAPVPKPPKPGFVLTLTHEEAVALHDVTHLIGGGSESTRRQHFDAIREALEDVGVPETKRSDINGKYRSIYFE